MSKRKITVTHHFETEIDTDRVDEWVEANFPEGRIQIYDLETGEHLYDDF